MITGGSRGIGAAVARAYVAEGAAVAVGYQPVPEMERLADALVDELVAGGGMAVALPADLTDPEQVESLVAAARESLGPVGIIVANAAASIPTPWRDIPVEQWDLVWDVNVRATWLLARAAYDDLVESGTGAIITVTSVMVETGAPGRIDYTASKAGVIGLTRALSRELGPDGVRVNAVMPGAIRTEHEVDAEPSPSLAASRILPLQALQRRGYAEDLAGAFVYLASDDSSFVTGQVINVDGGWMHY
jgi:3-oxoacyl-[acyl-carrier protein] reductase